MIGFDAHFIGNLMKPVHEETSRVANFLYKLNNTICRALKYAKLFLENEKVINKRKSATALSTILLTSIILMAATGIINVLAQGDQATVVISASVGGVSDPMPGTASYANGTDVVLTATPDSDFVFLYWLVSSDTNFTATDNPFTLTVTGGLTYNIEPVFLAFAIPSVSLNPPIDTSAYAIVEILASAGGNTQPAPGLYGLVSASQLSIKAVPADGFVFSHWVITGTYMPGHGGSPSLDTNVPTDNPLLIGHGEGYKYTYQAVFIPVGVTPPGAPPPSTSSTGISTEVIIAIVVVIVIVAVAAVAIVYMRRGKK